MTSTPVSLVESTESWVDINSASQIDSSNGDNSPRLVKPQFSLAESMQNLSFQVERFLQDAQTKGTRQSQSLQGGNTKVGNNDIYSSNSDISLVDHEQEVMMSNLRNHYYYKHNTSKDFHYQYSSRHFLKSSQGDILDCLSDSVSLLDRLSETEFREGESKIQDYDWLWEWTRRPEYFCGNEWKIYAPKNNYLSQQRQLIRETMDQRAAGAFFTRDVISLLFLTNILSIILGAGLTYGIIANKSAI